MFRYVPGFILDRFALDQYQGSFAAYVLLLDIADFTKIGTALQKEGNLGAEELSGFLHVAFAKPIQIINQSGGFVSLLAGDAVCAIFPNAKPESIVSAVNSISSYLSGNGEIETPFGAFALKIRQTIGYGEAHWQIFPNETQCEYVFYGKAMKELAELAKSKKDVVFSDAAAQNIGMELFEQEKIGCRMISNTISTAPNHLEFHYNPEIRARFIHPKFRAAKPQNEIRNAAFCFANLEGIAPGDWEKTISLIQSCADKYGGFVNKYDATDKGLIAVIIFGLPINIGKTLERVCNFSLEIVKEIPELALGISCGSVFAGYIESGDIQEYTALGQPLNLASRLMGKAAQGEVLTGSHLWQELNACYDLQYLGSMELKGFTQAVRYYRLSQRLAEPVWYQESPFVGRNDEIALIRSEIWGSDENTIVYISGDPGIGKSRLGQEALAIYATDTHHKFYVTCDAILTKPLDAIKQIVRSIFAYDPQLPLETGIANFRRMWRSIAGDKPQMQRIESVIASLLGYEWQQSVWSTIPPQDKPKQSRIAFALLMGHLAKTKPVLVHLDDGQWIDADSKYYLQALHDQYTHPIVIVSPCRYLNNGEKVDLATKGFKRIDIELASLNYADSVELIKTMLRMADIPADTRQLIYSRSMGNPLFIEQLASYLMESGDIDDQGRLTGEVEYLGSFGISDIINSRIDRLGEKVQECMFNASVLGIEFNVRVLTEMLNANPDSELEEGVKNRIWSELDEQHYVFSHFLIKDVVYQRMLSDKLQRLHQAAAEAMEIVYAESLYKNAEEIASHFEKGNILTKAAEYYDKAGEHYWSAFLLMRSEQNFQKSVELWELTLGKNSTEYAEALFHLGLLYHYLRDFSQIESIYLHVLEINETHHGKDSTLLSPYINNLGRFYKDIGRFEESEELLRRSLQIEIALDPKSSNVPDRLNNLAHLYSIKKDYAQAETTFLEAVSLLDKHYDKDFWFTAPVLTNLGMVYIALKRYEEAEPLLTRAHSINLKVNGLEHPTTALSLFSLAKLYMAQDKMEEAEPMFHKVLEIRENNLGITHSSVKDTIKSIVDLYGKTGEKEKEEEYRARLSRLNLGKS